MQVSIKNKLKLLTYLRQQKIEYVANYEKIFFATFYWNKKKIYNKTRN